MRMSNSRSRMRSGCVLYWLLRTEQKLNTPVSGTQVTKKWATRLFGTLRYDILFLSTRTAHSGMDHYRRRIRPASRMEKRQLIGIERSTRHLHIAGRFGQYFVCNWLSRSRFEVSQRNG